MTLREHLLEIMFPVERRNRKGFRSVAIDKHMVYYFIESVDLLTKKNYREWACKRFFGDKIFRVVRVGATETDLYAFEAGWFIRIMPGTRFEEGLKDLGFIKIEDCLLESEVTPL